MTEAVPAVSKILHFQTQFCSLQASYSTKITQQTPYNQQHINNRFIPLVPNIKFIQFYQKLLIIPKPHKPHKSHPIHIQIFIPMIINRNTPHTSKLISESLVLESRCIFSRALAFSFFFLRALFTNNTID